MGFYGKWETWKVVYYLPANQWSGGNIKGVALIEAGDRAHAMSIFNRQYAGQFHTIDSCTKLMDSK